MTDMNSFEKSILHHEKTWAALCVSGMFVFFWTLSKVLPTPPPRPPLFTPNPEVLAALRSGRLPPRPEPGTIPTCTEVWWYLGNKNPDIGADP